ncbi:MAG: aspartate--tRNA ligase [Ruminococcaceae bacterium]|nr:aspartate--tRNA ligase [Oscillospiraceae bacterium]
MYRTHYCGKITSDEIGKEVSVCGWVQKQRDLGSLIFIDLRDVSGIVQLAFDEATEKSVFETAFAARSEYVMRASGTVRPRAEGAVNKNMATGEIEIAVTSLELLSSSATPPFEIVENSDVKPELRLKYRYLDLRRPDLRNNIITRSKIAKETRDFFSENGFYEIETPVLVKATPEGARDYLVPSRVHPGSFYALPQSPQLYKQLLMLSGFDRYMQIAKCFRDEDLRADRQPEFTQIDLEMSFADVDDVIDVNERFLKRIFEKFVGIEVQLPIKRLAYKEAMERFGSDKPDLRYGFEIKDISEAVKGSEFSVFASACETGSVRAINIKGYGDKFTRKDIDKLTQFIKSYGAKGLAWCKHTTELTSSFLKFLSEEEKNNIFSICDFAEGDILFVVADAKNKVVFDSLGALRCHVAAQLGLADKNKYEFVWITDFPMFEYDEEEDRYVAMHHPFTAPKDEDLQYLESDPARVCAKAYDIVLNGWEMGGGSVRIHRRDVQERVFAAIGLSPEEAQEKFGFLLDAFKYGAPPHAGLAFGLDRLVSLVLGLDAIRDVIAFPKVQNASELMTGCPSRVPDQSLADLSIAVTKTETEE